MRDIATKALEPFRDGSGSRFQIEGENVRLGPKAALALAMSLHELATNATKYGALTNEIGRIRIAWNTDAGRLHLRWEERGGPPVAAPGRRGFGSRLIERSLAAELGGEVKVHYAPEGLVCMIDAPLARIASETRLPDGQEAA